VRTGALCGDKYRKIILFGRAIKIFDGSETTLELTKEAS